MCLILHNRQEDTIGCFRQGKVILWSVRRAQWRKLSRNRVHLLYSPGFVRPPFPSTVERRTEEEEERAGGLSLLLQFLEAPRQVVEVDVLGGGGASAEGGSRKCVGDRRKLGESGAIVGLGGGTRTWRGTRALSIQICTLHHDYSTIESQHHSAKQSRNKHPRWHMKGDIMH